MIRQPNKTWRGICSVKVPMLHIELGPKALVPLKFFGGCYTYWVAAATAYTSSGECGLNDCYWDAAKVLRAKVTHELVEDVRLFGCAQLHDRELGYSSLRELASVSMPVKMNGINMGSNTLERDLYWTPVELLAVRYDEIGEDRP